MNNDDLRQEVEQKEAQFAKAKHDVEINQALMERLAIQIQFGRDLLAKSAATTVTTTQPTTTTTTLPRKLKYDGMGITEAVADVVGTYGAEPGMFVPQIIEKLREGGFASKASDLYALVYTTCKKLIKQKRVWESKRSGKRSFMRSPYNVLEAW